jgi:hypothetical protein
MYIHSHTLLNMYLSWLRQHFERRNNTPAKFITELAESHPNLCNLVARDNQLYVGYKRKEVIAMLQKNRNSELAGIERGLKHMGMYCPEHGTVAGWKTWTWYDEYRVPMPHAQHAPVPPTMVVHGKRSRDDMSQSGTLRLAENLSDDDLTQDENAKVPKIAHTHAQALLNYMPLPPPTFPDELNTREWLNLFLRKDPQPVDIPGDWICEM